MLVLARLFWPLFNCFLTCYYLLSANLDTFSLINITFNQTRLLQVLKLSLHSQKLSLFASLLVNYRTAIRELSCDTSPLVKYCPKVLGTIAYLFPTLSHDLGWTVIPGQSIILFKRYYRTIFSIGKLLLCSVKTITHLLLLD